MVTIPRRLSIHDADYDPTLGQRLVVRLDGVDQHGRVEAYDLDAGTVTRAKVDADGLFVIEGTPCVADERGKTKLDANGKLVLSDPYVATETVSGVVEVSWRSDIDAYSFIGDRLPGESWSARHQRMLKALPADGGTLIVITNEIGRSLMKALRDDRGFAVRKRWQFISVRTYSDCAKLDGLSGRVIIDWTFAAHGQPEAQDRVRHLVAVLAAIQS